MFSHPINTSTTEPVAPGLALADWARGRITRERGPRPIIARMHNLRPATAEQREAQIAEFAREMKSRDAAADWDRAVMALIQKAEREGRLS